MFWKKRQRAVEQTFTDVPGILGAKVRDTISGFEGIATGYHIYLSGCNRISVQPAVSADGKLHDGYIFDESQVEVIEPARKPKAVTARGGPPTRIAKKISFR